MHSIRVTDGRMSFSAAHFVVCAGACERLHGHNYQVEVFVGGLLDNHGMVFDFWDIKERVADVCANLDHRVLLPGRSQDIKLREADSSVEVVVTGRRYVFPKDDCIVLPVAATTAELLAEYITNNLEFPGTYNVQVCVSEKAGNTGCYSTK